MSAGKAVGIGVAAVAGVAVLSAGGFWLNVALSGPKGVGDAIVEKNSSENWTAAQARFEEMYQDILATDKKIVSAHSALQLDPENPTLLTNYQGVVSYCVSVVGDYNAEARKFLSGDFRAADLPAEIDDLDPATNCKE